MKQKELLQIKLNSDLCTASGYAFGGTVDSDICYDDCGIPYIQGKRIKGCLRDNAEKYLGWDKELTTCLFGKGGDKNSGSVRIGNAYIQNYKEIHDEFQSVLKMGAGLISTQEILELFTRVFGQTRIDEKGLAEDNSLRYTRIINRYSPFLSNDAPHPQVFEAEVFCDEKDRAALEKALKATRNIGLHRSRGFGSVSCSLVSLETKPKSNTVDISKAVYTGTGSDIREVIRYQIQNTEPLMLSDTSDIESVSHISGQRILGILANRYLEHAGKAEDEAFKDLFLGDKTIFSDILPFRNEQVFYPAPAYIRKLKKTGVHVNLFGDNKEQIYPETDVLYLIDNGNSPKTLKGKYLSSDLNKVCSLDVDKEIIYHHRRKIGENEQMLFSWEVISKGQSFLGEIQTSRKYASLIRDLLNLEPLYFGKSRTVQYGKCELIGVPEIKEYVQKTISCEKDKPIVVNFLSDAVFVDSDRGEYTVYSDKIHNIAASQLGISFSVESRDYKEPHSIINTKILHGYMGVWNLQRQPIPAIAAGSCLVFYPDKDLDIPEEAYIGERNREGYGHIRIIPIDKMKYRMGKESAETVSLANQNIKRTRSFLLKIVTDHVLEILKKEAISGKKFNLNMTASGLGRITLMLKESLDEGKIPSDSYKYFKSRIESIKSESLKKEAKSKLLTPIQFSQEAEDLIAECVKWFGFGESEIKDAVNARWGEYLMTILVIEKNMKQNGGKDGNI